MTILVLNNGSSSLKSSLYRLEGSSPSEDPLWESSVQWTGNFENATIDTKSGNIKEHTPLKTESLLEAYRIVINSLVQGKQAVLSSLEEIDAVGHRVVHGGTYYQKSIRIDTSVKEKIRELASYAPLHNIPAVQGIEIMEQLLPNKPQVAVFDTAFHHTLPPKAFTYPVPYEWLTGGLRRYGFHGISHQYCAQRIREILPASPRKLVICHLGAGASLCAVQEGKSVDTTMGFTPLEGLMMNTRSGTIDPGILLERLKISSPEELSNDLYRKSGLLGLSGLSSDLREIIPALNKNPRARLAWDVYIHRLVSCIGSMVASLGGLDALVFTAGIGENNPLVREESCRHLAFLNIELDSLKNQTPPPHDCIISSKKSIPVAIIHTKEALAIARECLKITAYTQRT